MNLRRMHNRYCTLAFATLSAFAGLGTVSAVNAADASGAAGSTASSIQSQYQLDVQRCNAGQTNQSKSVCLQEAGAARDEAMRKRLDNNQSANYGVNSTERCTKLPQPQREDCLRQMQSPTKVEGSIQSGGVLRETVIQVPPGTPGSTTTVTPAPAMPGATTPGTPAPGTTMPSGPSTPAAPGGAATPVPVQQ